MPFSNYFENFTVLDYLSNALDILLVWFVVYKLLMVIRGTKAVQLVKGIFVIIVVRGLSGLLGLDTLSWIMEQALTWGSWRLLLFSSLRCAGPWSSLEGEASFLGMWHRKIKSSGI